MRLLVLLFLLLVVIVVLWVLYRSASRRAAATQAADDRYRVVETTGSGHAHVFVSRGRPETAALVGSVALTDDDFDERYAELVFLAEDRVATLNASRQLHAEG